MPERLHKVLARMGLGSRREIERWIEQGLVKADGKTARLGQTDEGISRVVVNGESITLQQQVATRVLQYHKPDDEICSRKDHKGRNTVYDHLPKTEEGRWVARGRMDVNT